MLELLLATYLQAAQVLPGPEIRGPVELLEELLEISTSKAPKPSSVELEQGEIES